MKTLLLLALLLVASLFNYAQSNTPISIPHFEDKYSNFIKQLEAGNTDINYRDFRESFIESKQFVIASSRRKQFDSLESTMYARMKQSNYQEVIHITRQMLGIDYTSMLAHKILRQTYEITGDTVNGAKYKKIQFGLLNSIVKNGDGKTCATAWPVIQVEEEYFILNMLGAKVLRQSIDNTGGPCDKMEVKTEEGESKTYYFDTRKVFEGYKKLGL